MDINIFKWIELYYGRTYAKVSLGIFVLLSLVTLSMGALSQIAPWATAAYEAAQGYSYTFMIFRGVMIVTSIALLLATLVSIGQAASGKAREAEYAAEIQDLIEKMREAADTLAFVEPAAENLKKVYARAIDLVNDMGAQEELLTPLQEVSEGADDIRKDSVVIVAGLRAKAKQWEDAEAKRRG